MIFQIRKELREIMKQYFPYNAKTPTGGRECLRFSYEGEIVIVSKRLRELFHH